MGELFRAQCPKCGYGKTFSLGGGLHSRRLSAALPQLGEADRAELLELQEHGRVAGFSSESQLMAACPCGETPMGQRLIVTIISPEGGLHAIGGHCAACGEALTPLKGREIPCPKCGEAIALRSTGYWD